MPSFAPSPAVAAPSSPYYSLPLPTSTTLPPLQRDYLSAQLQLRRHRAANATTTISGWRSAVHAGTNLELLWLSTDGASWVGRSVPSNTVPPTMVVDALGRITALYSVASANDPNGVAGDLRVMQSNENLTSWRSLGTGVNSGGPRYGYAVVQLPGNSNAVVWAAGSFSAVNRNDVWMYTGNDVGTMGSFTRQTDAAPWPARTFPVLQFAPASFDGTATSLAPDLSAKLIVAFGYVGGGSGSFYDVWSSSDLGVSWTSVPPTLPTQLGSFSFSTLGQASGVFGSSIWFVTANAPLFTLDSRGVLRVVTLNWVTSPAVFPAANDPPVNNPQGPWRIWFSPWNDRWTAHVIYRTAGSSIQFASAVMSKAALGSLAFSDQTGAGLAMWPAFEWSQRDYTLTAGNDTAAIDVLASFDYGQVTVSCNQGIGVSNGASLSLDAGSIVALVSGVASGPVVRCATLPVGSQTLDSVLTVVSADAVFRFTIRLPQITSLVLSLPNSSAQAARAGPFLFAPAFTPSHREYDMLIPADLRFPSQLQMVLGIIYGTARILVDGTEQLNVTAQAPFVVSLPPSPSGAASNRTVIISIVGATGESYTVRLANPCGFRAGQLSVPGSACGPYAACMPRGFSDWICSPSLQPLSLELINPSGAAVLPARTVPAGAGVSTSFRIVSLPAFDVVPAMVNMGLRIRSSFWPADSNFVNFRVLQLQVFKGFTEDSVVELNSASGSTTLGIDAQGPFLEATLPGDLAGSGMNLRLKCCGGQPIQCVYVDHLDLFSTPPAAFQPGTLMRLTPTPAVHVGSRPGELIALGMAEGLLLATRNMLANVSGTPMLFGPLAAMAPVFSAVALSPTSYITLPRFLAAAANASGPAATLLHPCVVAWDTVNSPGMVSCETPSAYRLAGERLAFLAWSAGTVAVSADLYSYPTQPVLSSVRGCTDSGGEGTFDCPTAGGVRLNLTGQSFASNMEVSVAGLVCGDVRVRSLPGGSAVASADCLLPAGTGNGASVVISSYGLLSAAVPAVSYAAPTITNVSCAACDGWVQDAQGTIRLTGCARQAAVANDTSRVLRLSGRNFGPPGSSVFVGGARCEMLSASDTAVSCVLPEGKASAQIVLLIQRNGKLSDSPHTVTYRECAKGSYDPSPAVSNALDCAQCPIGTFSSESGAGCSSCPAGLFLDVTSQRSLQSGPPSSSDCLLCLAGAVCEAATISSAADHYMARDSDGRLQSYLCPPDLCVPCPTDALQMHALGANTNASASGASLLAFDNVATCCAAHRDPASPLCGACLSGYEDWGGRCRPCTSSNGGLIAGFLLLTTALVAWLAHSASNASVGLTAVVMYFLQTAMLEVSGQAVLLNWLQAINFDPAFLTSTSSSTSCAMQLSSYGQVVLAVLMPLLLLCELACIACVHAMVRLCCGAGTGATEGATSDSTRTSRPSAYERPRIAVQRWSSRLSAAYYLNATVALLQFSYTSVAFACIRFLWCVEVGSARVVFSSPSMQCDSAEYARVLPLVLCALIGFVCGFPLLVLAGGYWRKQHAASRRAYADADSLAAGLVDVESPSTGIIPLYVVYRSEAWFWSGLVLVRRTLFVCLDVSLAGNLRVRGCALTLANLLSFLLSTHAAPFHAQLLNRCECASQMLLILLSLLLTAQAPPYSSAINGLLFALVLTAALMFVAAAVMQRRDTAAQLAKAKAARHKAQATSDGGSSAPAVFSPSAATSRPAPESVEIQLSPLHRHTGFGRASDDLSALTSPSAGMEHTRATRDQPVDEEVVDSEHL